MTKLCKTKANEALAVNGRKDEFVKIAVILTLINIVISTLAGLLPESAMFIASALTTLIIAPFVGFAYSHVALKVIKNQDIEIKDITASFNNFANIFVFSLINIAIIFIGILLFIIPGIIAALSLSMGFFILADEPGTTFGDAIKKSAYMMKGHRWAFFKLSFSYIGWFILSAFTLGILNFWIQPKMQTAFAAFYMNLKAIKYGEEACADAQCCCEAEACVIPEETTINE